jgi:hypothetical protein
MADTRMNLHQLLKAKQLYSALHGVHTEALHDLAAVLKEGATNGETAKTTITAPPSIEEFREQIRRKRQSTDEANKRAKKPTTSRRHTDRQQHQATSSNAGRPPTIVLTFHANLRQLERQLKCSTIGNFEFRNTRNRTRVVMKEMADFSAICCHFESNNLPYFTLYLKSLSR